MIQFVEEETNFPYFTFLSLCFSTIQSLACELNDIETTFLYPVWSLSLCYTRYRPTRILETVSPNLNT